MKTENYINYLITCAEDCYYRTATFFIIATLTFCGCALAEINKYSVTAGCIGVIIALAGLIQLRHYLAYMKLIKDERNHLKTLRRLDTMN